MTNVQALTSRTETLSSWTGVRRSRETDMEEVFRAIRSGDRSGAERLYALLHEGVRFFLVRSLGDAFAAPDVDDVFSVVLQAIEQGELRDPDALAGFALGVVKNHLSLLSRERTRPVKEAGNGAAKPEDIEGMRLVLQEVPERERETLLRVYRDGQVSSQVLREMGLTPAEFVEIKSRAKARFAELLNAARIPRKPVGSVRNAREAVALR